MLIHLLSFEIIEPCGKNVGRIPNIQYWNIVNLKNAPSSIQKYENINIVSHIYTEKKGLTLDTILWTPSMHGTNISINTAKFISLSNCMYL